MRRSLAVLSCVFASCAMAQPYPSKPVKLVVPWPAGGLVDIVGRTYGERLQADLGQPVIVDNKPGAGGMIGAELGAKAEPDGHTLVLTTTALTMNAALGQKGAEDTAMALVPLRNGAWAPSILVTRPGFPARTLKELVELAKAQPGKLTYASVGNGSPTHFASEMFKAAAGIDLVHIPYKGAPQAITDQLAGRVDVQFANAAVAMPQVKAGKMPALAITSTRRSALLPDVPTMAELGFTDFHGSQFLGFFAPPRTPRAIVERVAASLARAAANPDVQASLAKQAIDADVDGTTESFAALLRADVERWRRVVRSAQIKPD